MYVLVERKRFMTVMIMLVIKKLDALLKRVKSKSIHFLNVALHQATFALLMSKIKMNEIPVHFFTEVLHGRKFILSKAENSEVFSL